MPAPAHAATGTYLEGSFSTAAFAVPSGVQAGDLIVIPIYINAATGISAYASGFAEAPDSPQTNASGLAHNVHVVWKRATGGDTGTYDFPLSATDFISGAALRYTGCVTSGSPWDDTDGAVDVNDGVDTPPVSVTTTGADRLLVWAGASWSGGTWIPPSGFTERFDQGIGLVTAADKAQAAAGDSGTVQGTPSASSRRTAWLGALIGTATEQAGAAAAGLSGTGAAQKVAPDAGSTTGCLAGSAAAVKVAAVAGTCSLGGAATGTARKQALPVGTGALTFGASAEVMKTAGLAGATVAALGVAGAASRRVPQAGSVAAALAGTGSASVGSTRGSMAPAVRRAATMTGGVR